jgi:hypothetical protein
VAERSKKQKSTDRRISVIVTCDFILPGARPLWRDETAKFLANPPCFVKLNQRQ